MTEKNNLLLGGFCYLQILLKNLSLTRSPVMVVTPNFYTLPQSTFENKSADWARVFRGAV